VPFRQLRPRVSVKLPGVSTKEGWITRVAPGEWVARLAIVAAFAGLTIYTWAHWGDVVIDSGREMYVPAAMARGKVLYRDLWYPYGPLAPWLLAALFRWFGANLYVLYAFGLATTLSFALLLFEISRRFLPYEFAFVISFCALLQSFQADIFNYILPYSYAATIGSLMGLACLCFTLRSISALSRWSWLAAGLCAGLALLCKPEFGYACYATVAFAIVMPAVAGPARAFVTNALLCAPGLGAGLAAYIWTGLRDGAPILLLEGVFRSQTRYFMQTYGERWISDRGFRFHPSEVLQALVMLGLAILIWYLLARSVGWLMGHLWLLCCVVAAGIGAAAVLAMKMPFARALFAHRYFTEFAAFPAGMFWLACGVFVWSTVTFLRRRTTGSLSLAVASVYALAVGIRIMAQVEPRSYAIFYNSALFLLLVFVLVRLIDNAASQRPATIRSRLRLSLACLYAAWLGLLLMPYPKSLPARLVTDRGVIYTRRAEAAIFPRVISFIDQSKAEGRTVLILPESASLYFFTGTDAPARWYYLHPGVLGPDEESEFIAEIERQKVDFILLSNRRTAEYGSDYFGLDYNQRLYRWIEANYEPTGQFGEFVRAKDRPFAMLVYRRRR
jgi:hypothetical protein